MNFREHFEPWHNRTCGYIGQGWGTACQQRYHGQDCDQHLPTGGIYTVQGVSDMNKCLRCVTPIKCSLYGCSPNTWESEQSPMTHTLSTDKTTAVSNDYYWLPITADTPRGVKLLLLGAGGVAQLAQYDADPFWVGWFPLPRRAPCSILS